MGKKLALLSLTLHDLLLFAISYWVTHSTSSRTFYRTPWTLLTSSFPNQYTAQTRNVSDITITCLTQSLPRMLQGVSGTEPGLSPGGVLFRSHRVCLTDSDLSRRSSNNRSWNNITSCFHSSGRGFLSSLLCLRLQLKRMWRQGKDT